MRRLSSLYARPIAEHERRALLAAVTLLLITATLLLALTRHTPQHHTTRHSNGAAAARRVAGVQPARSAAAVRVSRAFLAGYLPYLYGHAPASDITNATGGLLRSLKDEPPRVSPAVAASDPEVVSLTTTAIAGGLPGVRALLNDGSLIDYAITLQLTSTGQLLVASLESE